MTAALAVATASAAIAAWAIDTPGSGSTSSWPAIAGWVAAGSLVSLLALLALMRAALPRAVWRQLGLSSNPALPLPRAAEDLRQAGPYLTIMSRQLGGALEMNGKGVEELVDLLNQLLTTSGEMQERVTQSTTNALELLRIVDEKVAMDRQLRRILEMFAQKQEEESVANLGRMERLRQVKGLGDLVEVISSVAQQTNFLAINAAIEAARAGPAGKGFAVVAGEIRNLSNQAAAAATKITAQIAAATDGIDAELAAVQQTTKGSGSTGSLQGVLDDIDAMQSRFNEAARNTHIESVFKNLADGQETIVALLTEAFGRIQFYDVLRQRVEQVQQSIQEFDHHLIDMADLLTDTSWQGEQTRTLRDRLDAQLSQYVSQAQQDTHVEVAQVQSHASAEARPAIELF
jgi:methyl-accepting chemotaxis protein